MSAVNDVDELIEQYHLGIGEFLKGNPEPVGKLHSRRDDVTLANPYGPPVRGLDQVLKAEEHAASGRRDGKTIGFEIVSKRFFQNHSREEVEADQRTAER